jgi:hypothetical protein
MNDNLNLGSEQSEHAPRESAKFFLSVIASIAAFVIAAYVIKFGPSVSNDQGTWGEFGDLLAGILNPVISLFTLLTALAVWSLQQREFKKTKIALDTQNKEMQKQRSEQVFFNLLSLRAEALSRVQWHEDANKFTGHEAVGAILDYVVKRSSEVAETDLSMIFDSNGIDTISPVETAKCVAFFCEAYKGRSSAFSTSFSVSGAKPLEPELGHIFRATFQILKFVYLCPSFSNEEKKDLVNFLRAQMGENEFALFALTALTSIGEKSRAISIALNFYEDRLYSIAGQHLFVAISIHRAWKILTLQKN